MREWKWEFLILALFLGLVIWIHEPRTEKATVDYVLCDDELPTVQYREILRVTRDSEPGARMSCDEARMAYEYYYNLHLLNCYQEACRKR